MQLHVEQQRLQQVEEDEAEEEEEDTDEDGDSRRQHQETMTRRASCPVPVVLPPSPGFRECSRWDASCMDPVARACMKGSACCSPSFPRV
eukprot:1156517-Pelagomonas_calceolata.AAC.3